MAVQQKKIKVLFITPERLFIEDLSKFGRKIGMICIDEIHQVYLKAYLQPFWHQVSGASNHSARSIEVEFATLDHSRCWKDQGFNDFAEDWRIQKADINLALCNLTCNLRTDCSVSQPVGNLSRCLPRWKKRRLTHLHPEAVLLKSGQSTLLHYCILDGYR